MYLPKFLRIHSAGCSKKCNSSISTERRKQVFENFYSLDWSLKNVFIVGQIIVSEIARKYTQSSTSRRANTRSYYLPDEQGRPPHEVCKTYFKDTLQICDGKITTVLKKKALTGTLELDKRGRHTPHNKTDAISEEYVCNFIKSFPACVTLW